jgi:hypothetical protein
MKVMLKVAVTIAVGAFTLGALDKSLRWMNQPSDSSFYLGTLATLVVLILSVFAISYVWRPTLRRRL